jgi:uncharacterized membrane protein
MCGGHCGEVLSESVQDNGNAAVATSETEFNDEAADAKTELTTTALPRKKRIWELDALRGFCIILVIFDHFMYTIGQMFGPLWFGYDMESAAGPLAAFCRFAEWYWTSLPRTIIHPIALLVFFALCGASCTFSRNNLKRGFLLLLMSIAVSIVTLLFDESVFIHFGTLTFLSFCILIWEFFSRLLDFNKTVKKYALPAVSFVCAAVVGILFLVALKTPFQNVPDAFGWLFDPFLTDVKTSFNSPGEIMAFIPWASFFFLGAAIVPVIYRKRVTLLSALDKKWHKPLSFIGRHTLIIYISHQTIIISILALISFLFITPGDFLVI